jgi:hypothetical protein
MLEALVAVGLAGNVVQFVQFASTLVLEAEKIRKNGSPSSLPALRKLTKELMAQAAVIIKSLKSSNATLEPDNQVSPLYQARCFGSCITDTNQNLLNTAVDCEQAGSQFQVYLNSLGAKPASSNPLRYAKASIKFRWAHNKIKNFVHRLDRFRNSLMLATVLALRSSSTGVHKDVFGHLKALQDGGQVLLTDNLNILSTLQTLVDLVQDQFSPSLKEL